MDEDRDQIAARYVLGLARGQERSQIEARAERDPDLRARISRWEVNFAPLDLAEDVELPPADFFDSVLTAIAKPAVEIPGTHTIRAAEAQWTETSPGVSCRILYDDPTTRRRSKLIRLQPGAVNPSHGHPNGVEECYVIEGDLAFDDLKLFAGDFHLAHMSSTHPVSKTTGGCLLLITCAF